MGLKASTIKEALNAVKTADTLAFSKSATGTYSIIPVSIEKASTNTSTAVVRATTGTSAYTNPVSKVKTVSAAIQDVTTTESKVSKVNSASTASSSKVSYTTSSTKTVDAVESPNVAKLTNAAANDNAAKILSNAGEASSKSSSSVLSKVGTAAKVTGIASLGAIVGAAIFGTSGNIIATTNANGNPSVTQDENGNIVYQAQDMQGVNDALSFLQDQINEIADALMVVIDKVFSGDGAGVLDAVEDIPIIGDIVSWIEDLLSGLFGGTNDEGVYVEGSTITIPGTDIKIPTALVIGLVILAAIVAFVVLKKKGKIGKKPRKNGGNKK